MLFRSARQVVDYWQPHIDIDPEWDSIELGEISTLITKGTTPTTLGFRFEKSGINFIKVETISENGIIDYSKRSFISEECNNAFKRSKLQTNDILFSIAGTKMGISALVETKDVPANTNQALAIIRLRDGIEPLYILYYLRSPIIMEYIESSKSGVAQFNLSLKQVSELAIKLPDLKTQQAIVDRIESELKLVDANRQLIKLYGKKIKDKINKLWRSE